MSDLSEGEYREMDGICDDAGNEEAVTRDLADTVKALRYKLDEAIAGYGEIADAMNGLHHSISDYFSAIHIVEKIMPIIEPAIRDLIAKEREECAQLVSEQKSPYHDWGGGSFNSAMQHAAKLIRARGGKS